MKKLMLIVAFMIVSPAIAQDVTLTVNQKELGMIGEGLGKLPFNDVSPLFNKLQGQVIEQQKKTEAIKPTETSKSPEKPVDNAQTNK